MHMESMNFNNCTCSYKDERGWGVGEGRRWSFYIFVEFW